MENIKEVTEEEIVQARRAYQKEYRAKNKEKYKEYNRRWLAKMALKMAKETN